MNRKFKRVIALAASAVLAAGMLSGCGEKKNAGENGEKIKDVMWTKVSQDANDAKKEVYEK